MGELKYKILQNEATINLLIDSSESFDVDKIRLLGHLVQLMYRKNVQFFQKELEGKLDEKNTKRFWFYANSLKRLGDQIQKYLILHKLSRNDIFDFYSIQRELQSMMIESASCLLGIIDVYTLALK